MPRFVTASLIALAVGASPALAQPGGTAARPATVAAVPVPAPPPATNPPVTTNPPPVTTTPPDSTAPPPQTTPPPETAPVNQPVRQAPPQPAPEVLPDNVSYQDPPMDNYFRADNDRDGGGFPWGLLGLLGLLGLVPWIRGTGPKTIYVEREKPKPDEERR